MSVKELLEKRIYELKVRVNILDATPNHPGLQGQKMLVRSSLRLNMQLLQYITGEIKIIKTT